jgi:transcriptional antiterminator RfaH
MSDWLVVNTQPNSEMRAEYHLKRQGYCVYLPRYTKTRRHARKTEKVVRPLFPRYLFVEYDPNRTPWRAIQSTIGVSRLVLAGEKPLSAHQDILDEIRRREGVNGLVALGKSLSFQEGQSVCVTEGPLCDQVGLFQCADDNQRAIVLMELLGRHVKARIPVEILTSVN